jgi:PAS domain S-box-containing protein
MPSINSFFVNLDEVYTAEMVFDCFADVLYFVKNERAEYVVVNRAFAERCGTKDKRTLIGKTAFEVFPPPFGQTFLKQDQHILTTGLPVLNQLELHLYPNGRQGWAITEKFPLRGKDGNVVGLVGISRDAHAPNESAEEYRTVAQAIEYAHSHLDERLTMTQLAAIAKLSEYQFDQRVRRLFRMTTGQLIIKLRMDFAAEQLRDTKRSVAAIGQSCGYSDQSGFTRQFHRIVGLTPLEYRKMMSSEL